ncbi:UNVERIFIED_CONTAM: hypothetical protein NY603_18115 [Bacteroidetes bacterium 56_B9]
MADVPAECPIRYTRADESCRPQKTPPLHYQPKGDTPTVQLQKKKGRISFQPALPYGYVHL